MHVVTKTGTLQIIGSIMLSLMPKEALMQEQIFAEEILDRIINLKITVIIPETIAHYAVNVTIWLVKAVRLWFMTLEQKQVSCLPIAYAQSIQLMSVLG